MRKIAPLALLLFLLMNSMLFAGLCTTGKHTGNPHCQSHTSDSGRAPSGTTTGLGSTGVTPDTATTNPHTGTITPDHHNAQLIPSQVVTGTYAKGPSGYAPVPPQPIATPTAIPTPVPHQVPQPTPGKIPQLVPSQVVTGTVSPGATSQALLPKTQPTHYIGVVSKGTQVPVTSGRHTAQTSYGFNVIEPGIQNKQVAVYRSNDAREMLYKDTIKMDNTGFLLIDLGVRDPDYIK